MYTALPTQAPPTADHEPPALLKTASDAPAPPATVSHADE